MIQVIVDGNKRRLVIKDTMLNDAGEIEARTNKDSAKCTLKVARKYINLPISLGQYTLVI